MDINHTSISKRTQKILFNDLLSVLQKQNGLMIYYRNNTPVYLHGVYKLYDDVGCKQGSWQIRITIPKSYPYGFPELYETSMIIPPIPCRHMGLNRLACTELGLLAKARAKKGISISQFLDEFVFRYFSWQLLYDAGFEKNLESWSHGTDGLKDFVFDIFKSSDTELIKNGLTLLINRQLPDRNSLCFCSSGKRFKKCHGGDLKTLDNNYTKLEIIEVLNHFQHE